MADQHIRLAGGHMPTDRIVTLVGDDSYFARTCRNCKGACCGMPETFVCDDAKERIAAFELVNWFISTVSGAYWREMMQAIEVYNTQRGDGLRREIRRMKEGDNDGYTD